MKSAKNRPADRRIGVTIAMALILLAAAGPAVRWVSFVGAQNPGTDAPPSADRPTGLMAGQAKGVRLDRFGDPLPPGAVARIGTMHLQHGCPVMFVCYSPDGKLIASTGYDKFARVWEVATGRQIRSFFGTFGPVGFTGGSRALIMEGERVSVRDLSTGQTSKLLPLDGGILGLSPDGKTLAVTCGEGVCVWDMAAEKELGRFKCKDSFRIAVSRDI